MPDDLEIGAAAIGQPVLLDRQGNDAAAEYLSFLICHDLIQRVDERRGRCRLTQGFPPPAAGSVRRGAVNDIRTILAAYNRSNGLNLVALAALLTQSPSAPDHVNTFGTPGYGIAGLIDRNKDIEDQSMTLKPKRNGIWRLVLDFSWREQMLKLTRSAGSAVR
jgi:hypothetical protein